MGFEGTFGKEGTHVNSTIMLRVSVVAILGDFAGVVVGV